MVDKAALQAWAQGKSSKGIAAGDEGDEGADDMAPDEGSDDLEEMEGEEGEAPSGDRETLWAGEEEDPASIAPERAQQLLDWLSENEPIIYEVVVELGEAVANDDPDMTDHAKEEMGWAEQKLAGDYPELTETQRTSIGDFIAEELGTAGNPAKDSPEWVTAIAVAIGRARKEA